MPVTWPPGRERLLIKPLPTGSDIERNDGSGGRRRSSGVNGGQTGRKDDIDLALDQLHCKWVNASGIAAGRANDEFDIVRLSVPYRLKCIPERSDARRQR